MKKNAFLKLISPLLVCFCFSACSNFIESVSQLKITYKSSMDNAPSSKMVKENHTMKDEDLPFLYVEGYHFEGWYLEDSRIQSGYIVSENITLEAKWSNNNYQIRFNSNGGMGYMDNQTFSFDKISHLNKNKYYKNGYIFVEWNTKEDGSGDKYTDETSILNLTTNNNDIVVLYAQWEKTNTIPNVIFSKTGTVDYLDTVELYNPIDSVSIYYSMNKEGPFSKYEKPIHIEDECTIYAYAEKDSNNHSELIHQSYFIKNYTVSFNSNGINSTISPLSFKKTDILKLDDLPRISSADHNFLGWYLDGNLVQNDIQITKDIVLVAQWQEIGKTSNVIFITENKIDYLDTVELSCPNSTATIYYSLNKNGPFSVYEKPISIEKDCSIYAYAKDEKLKQSETISKSYTIKTYKVSFIGNGIDNPSPKTGLKKTDTITLPIVSRTGFNFLGWYLDDKKLENNISITQDMVLVAIWQEISKTPTVIFNKVGSVDYLDTVELSCPISSATIFYSLKENGPFSVYETPISIEKNCSIYAYAKDDNLQQSDILQNSYHIKTYVVSFNGNGVTAPNAIPGFKKTDTLKYSELREPSKDGFNFLGWFLDGNLVEKDIQITKDTVLVAQWQEIGKTPNVYFNKVGSVDYLDTVELSCPNDSATIYYSLNKNGPFSVYEKPISINNNCTIYAYAKDANLKVSDTTSKFYTIKTYVVSFNGNGGTSVEAIPDFKKTDTLNFSELREPSRDGFNFLGWSLDGNLVEKDITITKDTVLVAQWQEIGKTPNVYFNKVGSIDYLDTVELSCPRSSATIYYSLEEKGPFHVYENPISIEKNCSIYAYAKDGKLQQSETVNKSYTIKTYKVSFIGNGIVNPSPKTGLKKTDTITLPIVSRTGFNFLGWYLDDTNLGKGGNDISITQDLVLVAQWQEIGKTQKVIFNKAGSVDYLDTVELSCPSSSATIYYSLDKNGPFIVYENPITIEKDCSIYAYATEDKLQQSDIVHQSYTMKTYKVSFIGNGIKNPSPETGLKKTDSITLPIVSRTGFNFLGWYLDDTNLGKGGNDISVIQDLVLFAQWQEIGKTPNVIFNKVGSVDYLDTVELYCPSSSATIYYSLDENGPFSIYENPIKIENNCSIYAYATENNLDQSDTVSNTYTIKTYTVNFYTNGADNSTVISKTGFRKGDYITEFPEITKQGHTLLRWENSNGEIVNINEYEINNNETIIAVWEKQLTSVQDVVYTKKTVNSSLADNEIDYGDTVELNTPTQGAYIYYTIDGISNPPENSKKYNNPIEIKAENSITIKAIAMKDGYKCSNIITKEYNIKKYIIEYDNSGKGAITPSTNNHRKYYEITNEDLPTLETNDFVFEGWYVGEQKIEAGYKIEGNLKLTAKWKPSDTVSPVTFDKTGEVDYNEPITLSCTTPGASIYYTLDGSDPKTKGSLYSEPIKVTTPLTIRAIAKKTHLYDSKITENVISIKTYKIIYTRNTLVSIKLPAEVTGLHRGSKITSEYLPRMSDPNNNYKFSGWYYKGTDKECRVNDEITGDITLELKWYDDIPPAAITKVNWKDPYQNGYISLDWTDVDYNDSTFSHYELTAVEQVNDGRSEVYSFTSNSNSCSYSIKIQDNTYDYGYAVNVTVRVWAIDKSGNRGKGGSTVVKAYIRN